MKLLDSTKKYTYRISWANETGAAGLRPAGPRDCNETAVSVLPDAVGEGGMWWVVAVLIFFIVLVPIAIIFGLCWYGLNLLPILFLKYSCI